MTLKNSKYACVAFVGVMFLALFFMNWWCLPAHDELAYTFQGECTPYDGVARHIASLGDIVRSEMAEYSHGPSGRVFLHGIVQLFAGWELYHFFDFCNTVVWFALVWLILAEAKVRRSLRSFALGAAVIFWFYFYSETCTYNMAFAMNYLWMSCVTILFVGAWRKYESWWMLPAAFFYGWGQEVFSLAVMGGLGFWGLVRFCRERRYPWSGMRTAMYMALLLGVIGCCGSHFLSGRAEHAEAGGIAVVLGKIVKAQLGLAIGVWPFVLIVLVLAVLWMNRRRLPPLLSSTPEWWAIFLCGWLEYLALGAEGLRIACPMLLSGVVLILVNRENLRSFANKLAAPCVLMAALWIVVAAVLQYKVGKNLQVGLDVYRANADGVTYRASSSVGPWGMVVSPHLFGDWHRVLFRHQFRKELPPAFLSPTLYETLYLDPPRFFKMAEEVLPGGYALPGEGRYLVLKARDGHPAPERIRECQSAIARRSRPSGWRRCLPGRIRVWLPPSDLYLGLPSNPFVLKATDGNEYVIVTGTGE